MLAAEFGTGQVYVQDVAGNSGGGTAGEIAKLAELRDRGVITEDEFQRAKARALA